MPTDSGPGVQTHSPDPRKIKAAFKRLLFFSIYRDMKSNSRINIQKTYYLYFFFTLLDLFITVTVFTLTPFSQSFIFSEANCNNWLFAK